MGIRFITIKPLGILVLGIIGSACTPQGIGNKEAEKLEEIKYAPITPERPRINIIIQNFCPNQYEPSQQITLDDFFVRNLSAHITPNSIETDTDSDGVPDLIEADPKYQEYGIFPQFPDSNDGGVGDGYGDLVIFRAGFSLKSQNKLRQQTCSIDKCKASGKCDEHGYYLQHPAPYSTDRLNICEKEIVLGLNPEKSDNSNIGVPDYMKVLSGVNPSDPAEIYLKTAGDTKSNLEKIKLGLPVNSVSNSFIEEHTPRFTITKKDKPIPGPTAPVCDEPLELKAENLALAPTSNDNLILTYIGFKNQIGEKKFQFCCTLVEPKKPGTRSIEVNWPDDKNNYNTMMCPCPNRLRDIPGRSR